MDGAREFRLSKRLWILGAPDPEMEAVEVLLRKCGEAIEHATVGGERVHPGNAYRADSPVVHTADHDWSRSVCDGCAVDYYRVECDWAGSQDSRVIDHHRPGDPGFGHGPQEFFESSSIGQVVLELARLGSLPASWVRPHEHSGAGAPGQLRLKGYRGQWLVSEPRAYLGEVQPRHYQGVLVPDDLVYTAAADHCLGAAYAGECQWWEDDVRCGVDPTDLGRHRAASRARHQGRTVEAVLADIESTQAALHAAPLVTLRSWVAGLHCDECRMPEYCATHVVDMRREPPWPELPEAATRLGVGYLSGPLESPDGRRKLTVSGDAEQVRAFLDHWAPAQGLVDCYGDPARGFAGGYLA